MGPDTEITPVSHESTLRPYMSRPRPPLWILLLVAATAACHGGDGDSPVGVDGRGKVEGTVTLDGLGLEGVTVFLEGQLSYQTETPESGGFFFDDLPLGTYQVEIAGLPEHAEFAETRTTVLIQAPGQHVRADFQGTVRADASIQGRVTLRGVGVEGLIVSARGPEAMDVTTGDGGWYALTGLKRGIYTVSLLGVDENTQAFPFTVQSVDALGGSPNPLDFTGVPTSPVSDGPNLTIPALHISQATQTLDGQVPLVAGRDGVLRVFAISTREIQDPPEVRVEVYQGDHLVRMETLPPPSVSVPTDVGQSLLTASWNLPLPGSMIRPSLRIRATVDPTHRIGESDEGDNHFPPSGIPLAMDVRTTPTFAVTFIPIRQSATGLVGNVSATNASEFMDWALRMAPISDVNVQVHPEYVTDAPALDPYDRNQGWSTILSEIQVIQLLEDQTRYYYGVVDPPYGNGTVGMSYVGSRVAMGWDRLPNGASVALHEWGHNWLLAHAPGCGAYDPDPSYPYPSGSIGAWGLDVADLAAKPPSLYHDFMGYCYPRWISDYHYERILQFRSTWDAPNPSAPWEPGLLIWGRVSENGITLEPVFRVHGRPALPQGEGPFHLVISGPDGGHLFSRSFRPTPNSRSGAGQGHFAFIVPLRVMHKRSPSSIRIRGQGFTPVELALGGKIMATPTAPVRLRKRANPGVEVEWSPAAFPMALIRDAASGAVLAFGRRGSVRLPDPPSEIQVLLTDGMGASIVRRFTTR